MVDRIVPSIVEGLCTRRRLLWRFASGLGCFDGYWGRGGFWAGDYDATLPACDRSSPDSGVASDPHPYSSTTTEVVIEHLGAKIQTGEYVTHNRKFQIQRKFSRHAWRRPHSLRRRHQQQK
ncbi:hypothetical protein PM082_005119 [Marasmius tenuissimus]|nr:hypothetical protein PM082_005119 [Marasmius tenuissimus]